MSFIHLTTFIEAPVRRVFDLSRSVKLHKDAMSKYGETITAGTMSGLLNKNDTVTWKAKHLFKQRLLKIQLTHFNAPEYYVDEQLEGDFKIMKHQHYFKPVENGTIMIDQFHYEIAYGFMGKLFNKIYIEKYLTRLLEQLNASIKKAAEGNQWKQLLGE